jgi:hypothetical protein
LDEELSFTMLRALLFADPELDLVARGIKLGVSTLQRRLAADPRYSRIKRARKLARRRGRFVARHPHEIWHLDAKGPVTAKLVGGGEIVFHVLTVLDDASRDTLASIVASSPDLRAAVRVFRLAAKRWGLPDRVYSRPRSTNELRGVLRVRKASLLGALQSLKSENIVVRQRDGWALQKGE